MLSESYGRGYLTCFCTPYNLLISTSIVSTLKSIVSIDFCILLLRLRLGLGLLSIMAKSKRPALKFEPSFFYALRVSVTP